MPSTNSVDSSIVSGRPSPGQTKIAIIGLGYVGLPLAVEFGKQLDTIGYDIRESRVNELRQGKDSTLEVDPDELAAAFRLKFETKLDGIAGCNVFATSALSTAHGPWGAGIGPFVEVFEQAAPATLLLERYVNHAHNEYLQLWLEAGWLGMVVATAAILAFLLVAIRAFRNRASNRAHVAASAVAVAALLAHSWVDYPLRTGSLAAVAAVLCAIVVVATSRAGRATGDDVQSKAATA